MNMHPDTVVDWSEEASERSVRARRHLMTLYKEVKLEWSMCLQPEAWQESYEELMRDYSRWFAGGDLSYSLLSMRSYSLIGWVRHTNESVIRYNMMHVEKREWHYDMIANGHMEVFGSINGLGSLSHLEAKVTQVPGVMRTRISKSKNGLRPCLTMFVSSYMLSEWHRDMVSLIKAHVDAENAGVSLVGRQRASRYDFVDVGYSPAAFSLGFNVSRYDLLDFSKSTVFQRFRRRRKYRERKPPNANTILGRLKMAFRNGKVIKHWVKTGETLG